MKKNIGTADRSIRLVVAGLLLYLGFFPNPLLSGGIAKSVIGVLAIIPLFTALLRFCPLYTLIEADTNRKKTSP